MNKDTKIRPFVTKSFLSEIIELLGVDPRLKLMKIISTPEIPEEHIVYTNNSWSSLMKRAYQMLITKSNESKIDWGDIFSNANNNKFKTPVKINSMMSIYRGKNLEELDELNSTNNNPIRNLCKDNNLISHQENFDKNEICKYEKHLTLLNNSNFLCEDMRNTLNKAYEMYEFNAFVHQYEKYGMEKQDFLDAFAFCEQIVFDYNNQ